MARASWTLIANPVSGRGRALRVMPKLIERLESDGVEATVAWTQGPDDAEALAKQAVEQGAALVVACGGDGTVHQAINGIMAACGPGSPLPLGIVPLGRCNDLSTALGVPRSVQGAADTLLRGRLRTIDLARATGRYFSTVATLGFDSAVTEYVATGSSPLFRRGTIAYFYAVMVKLLRYRDVSVCLRGESWEYEGPIFLAATGNTSSYGGRFRIVPAAVMDDGLLTICLIRSAPRWEVLMALPRLFTGSHVRHPKVSVEQARRMEVHSTVPLSIWADGERVASTPTVIEIVPKALSVLVPAEAAA